METYVILNKEEDRVLVHHSFGKYKLLSGILDNESVDSFQPKIYTSKLKAWFHSLGYKIKPKKVRIVQEWCPIVAVQGEPKDYLWLQSKFTGKVLKFYKESSTNTIFNKHIIRYDGSLWIHKVGKVESSYFSHFKFKSYVDFDDMFYV
jgi:hypothetical protein